MAVLIAPPLAGTVPTAAVVLDANPRVRPSEVDTSDEVSIRQANLMLRQRYLESPGAKVAKEPHLSNASRLDPRRPHRHGCSQTTNTTTPSATGPCPPNRCVNSFDGSSTVTKRRIDQLSQRLPIDQLRRIDKGAWTTRHRYTNALVSLEVSGDR